MRAQAAAWLRRIADRLDRPEEWASEPMFKKISFADGATLNIPKFESLTARDVARHRPQIPLDEGVVLQVVEDWNMSICTCGKWH